MKTVYRCAYCYSSIVSIRTSELAILCCKSSMRRLTKEDRLLPHEKELLEGAEKDKRADLHLMGRGPLHT